MVYHHLTFACITKQDIQGRYNTQKKKLSLKTHKTIKIFEEDLKHHQGNAPAFHFLHFDIKYVFCNMKLTHIDKV